MVKAINLLGEMLALVAGPSVGLLHWQDTQPRLLGPEWITAWHSSASLPSLFSYRMLLILTGQGDIRMLLICSIHDSIPVNGSTGQGLPQAP